MDEDGRFEVMGPPSGMEADGQVRLSASYEGRTGEATAPPGATHVAIRLGPAATLEGELTPQDGTSPGEVTLRLEPTAVSGRGSYQPPVRVFGERFRLTDLPPGEMRITARSEAGQVGSTQARLASGEVTRVRLVLEDSGKVTGTVRSEAGPARFVRIELVGADGGVVASGRVEADGRFELVARGGTYRLRATSRGPRGQSAERELQLPSSGTVEVGELVLRGTADAGG